MSPASYAAFALAIAVFGLVPGPVIVTTVARCLTGGFRAGVSLNAGVVVGDVLFLAAAVYGLSWIAEASAPVFAAVKWAGAAYLVVLGVQLWRTEPQPLDAGPAPAVGGYLKGMAAGLALALGNPKAILFYGALLPTFFDLKAVTATDLVWLALIDVAILTLVNNGYGLVASRARAFVRSRRAIRAVNRTAAGAMIGAGVAVAAR